MSKLAGYEQQVVDFSPSGRHNSGSPFTNPVRLIESSNWCKTWWKMTVNNATFLTFPPMLLVQPTEPGKTDKGRVSG